MGKPSAIHEIKADLGWEMGIWGGKMGIWGEKWGFGVVCAGNVPVEGLSLILPRLLCGILSTEEGEKEN